MDQQQLPATPCQAVMLAAGMGTRLGALTADAPKCMVRVGQATILERAVRRLESVGIEELLVVTGYKADVIRGFLDRLDTSMRFAYVNNADFATTNNIYSLWLAADEIRPPFLLLESDIVFSRRMLTDLLPPQAASLSPLQEWMNGTVVTLDGRGMVDAMYLKQDARPDRPLFKTVNMYSFDAATWSEVIRPRLNAAVQGRDTASYYEAVFAQAVRDSDLTMRGAVCPVSDWYEIDTPEDLKQAENALATAT